MKIIHNHQSFELHLNKQVIGEITYQLKGTQLLIADHTFINPSFRNQGYAKQLVDALVVFARQTNKKISPLCPYVLKIFTENSEYEDIWEK